MYRRVPTSPSSSVFESGSSPGAGSSSLSSSSQSRLSWLSNWLSSNRAPAVIVAVTAACSVGFLMYMLRNKSHSIQARHETPRDETSRDATSRDEPSQRGTSRQESYGSAPKIIAKLEQRWEAKVLQCVDMNYQDGERKDLDRPGFVRSASSLRLLAPPERTSTPHQYALHVAIIQDDVNLVAHAQVLVTTYPKPQMFIQNISTVPLIRGPGQLRQYDKSRHNKKYKLDLEASAFVTQDISPTGASFYLGFGSGSIQSGVRDVIVYIPSSLFTSQHEIPDEDIITVPAIWTDIYGGNKKKLPLNLQRLTTQQLRQHVVMIWVPELYDVFRKHTEFSGSELNVEGWECFGTSPSTLTFRLFQRGNGAPDTKTGLKPINATADIEGAELFSYLDQLLYTTARPALFNPSTPTSPITPPSLNHIIQYDLGKLGGVPLGFTDAARMDHNKVMYIAGAEASEDAGSDGDVTGAVVGILTNDSSASYTQIKNTDGTPFMGKAEGIAIIPHDNPASKREIHALLSLDPDSPTTPSQLCYMIATMP